MPGECYVWSGLQYLYSNIVSQLSMSVMRIHCRQDLVNGRASFYQLTKSQQVLPRTVASTRVVKPCFQMNATPGVRSLSARSFKYSSSRHARVSTRNRRAKWLMTESCVYLCYTNNRVSITICLKARRKCEMKQGAMSDKAET